MKNIPQKTHLKAPLVRDNNSERSTPAAALQPRKLKRETSTKKYKDIEKKNNKNALFEEKNHLSKNDVLGAIKNMLARDGSVVISNKASTSQSINADLQILVNELSSRLYIMRTQGQTEFALRLNNIPLFRGALVTITGYDNANGEFNLSFSDLSYQAKVLLDNTQNQSLLKESLENKGYKIHILTATTETERPEFQTRAHEQQKHQQQRQDSHDNDQGSGQQKKQKSQDPEGEVASFLI